MSCGWSRTGTLTNYPHGDLYTSPAYDCTISRDSCFKITLLFSTSARLDGIWHMKSESQSTDNPMFNMRSSWISIPSPDCPGSSWEGKWLTKGDHQHELVLKLLNFSDCRLVRIDSFIFRIGNYFFTLLDKRLFE